MGKQDQTKPSNQPGETFFKTWDLRLAVFGTILTLIGFLITQAINARNLSDSVAQAKREANKAFYEKQLDLYIQASEAVATMATLPSEKEEWQNAYFKFLRLYTGPLFLVESPEVRKKMVDIRTFLLKCKVENSIYASQPVRLTSSNRSALEIKSQELAELMFAGTNEWWEFKRTPVMRDNNAPR